MKWLGMHGEDLRVDQIDDTLKVRGRWRPKKIIGYIWI